MKLYTSAAVAKRIDVTERYVRALRDRGILTEKRPGLFDIDCVVIEYIRFLRKSNPDAETKIDYNTERALLVKAKREEKELELMHKKNEMHFSEEIEQAMTDMLIRFKSRLISIPAKLSPILSQKTKQEEIFKILKNGIDEALDELSDYNSVFGEENEE